MANTTNLNLPLIDGTMTADVVRDLNALADAVDSGVAKASDLASHKVEKVTDAHEPTFQGYQEVFQTLTGTAPSLNADSYNVFKLAITGATTFTFSTTKTDCLSLTLFIEQGATAYGLTFPASVKWKDGEIPDLSTANKTYVLTFVTYDQGVSWLGSLVGAY